MHVHLRHSGLGPQYSIATLQQSVYTFQFPLPVFKMDLKFCTAELSREREPRLSNRLLYRDSHQATIFFTTIQPDISTFLLIFQKLINILIPNFNIMLRSIFGLYLVTRNGNRRRNFNKYHWFVQLNLVPLIPQKILTISIPNFSIILRDIFGLHLFTGSGNRKVYTDSQRVVIGICGRGPLWQRTIIWHQNYLVAKCSLPLLIFCQNLGQNGRVVLEKMPKKTKFLVAVQD